MKVSIIIPSLNSPIIDRVIHHLRQQTLWQQVGEILVVGKDDSKLLPVDSIVKFIDTDMPVSASKARNIGIQSSQHDLLVFLDSDCIPFPDWLEEHIKAHEAGHFVVGGGVKPRSGNYWSISYNLALFHEFMSTNSAGYHRYLPTLNLSVRREVVEIVGVLDETLSRGQDIEWTQKMYRAGYHLWFSPLAVIEHIHNRTTFSRVWRDCARSGFYMRQIRLQNDSIIAAPSWLRYRTLILVMSPAIAMGVTLKILIKRPIIRRQYRKIIPAIYLTKIAWCWGASRRNAPFNK